MTGIETALVRPEGLEPPAYWFEASRDTSCYGRLFSITKDKDHFKASASLEVRFPVSNNSSLSASTLSASTLKRLPPKIIIWYNNRSGHSSGGTLFYLCRILVMRL